MTIRKYQAGNRGANALKEEPSNAKPIDLQLLIDQLRIALETALANGGGSGEAYDDTAIQQAISALQSGKANSTHDHNTAYYTRSQIDTLLSGVSGGTYDDAALWTAVGSIGDAVDVIEGIGNADFAAALDALNGVMI